ncbi:unnamed protein product [Diabrotica balteata]|uniref:Uncharacterized protein n=1 Tax=Diabrotica balteata TaxID=107213 RepID=A0A9N9SP55_DIABA|nr:unnamed protein product [Diabrotica balteata]
MEPTTFCGACDTHVWYENHELKAGEQIKLFNIDGEDTRTVWLDMRNCSEHCTIGSIDVDALCNLKSLEGINIRDSEISEINLDTFAKLENIKFLSLHHNNIQSDLNYNVFEQLKTLETIHFDTNIYYTLNFDNFPSLHNVRIGYKDDGDEPDLEELIARLNAKDIKTEYIFCGTVDCDTDDIEECC